MIYPRSRTALAAPFLALALAGSTTAWAEDVIPAVCDVALHEESLELQEELLAVDLARSAFIAREEIYQLVADLMKEDAVDRMTYLRARYDRDAAKLELERADLVLIRQRALIEHLELACEEGSDASDGEWAGKLERAFLLYRRADCDQQAKAIEVAETDLEFNRRWLASILDLRDQVSTRQDVILAELDVKLAEQRRDDARRRTEACRAELEPPAR